MSLLRRRAVARAVPVGQHSYPPAAGLARAGVMSSLWLVAVAGAASPSAGGGCRRGNTLSWPSAMRLT